MAQTVYGAISQNEFGFIKPVTTNYTITSEWGYRAHPVDGEVRRHTGIDIVPVHRSDIVAVQDGIVVFAGCGGAFGNSIEIRHEINGQTIYSFYAHLSAIHVNVGDTVVRGQHIAQEGGDANDPNPGNSTGHHLHFEIRTSAGFGNDVNPRDFIDFGGLREFTMIGQRVEGAILRTARNRRNEGQEDLLKIS